MMLVFCPKCALLYAVASANGRMSFYVESTKFDVSTIMLSLT